MSTATASRKSTTIDAPATSDVASDAAVEPTLTFQVIHRNVLLGDHTRTSPMSRVVTGDVARLSSGKTVSRVASNVGYAYEPFAADPRLSSNFGSLAINWESKINTELETMNVRSGVRVLQPTTFAAEVARFQKEYPSLADYFLLGHDIPNPAFNVGPVSYAIKPPDGLLFADDLWSFIHGHAAGDFGTHGTLDYAAVTEEQLWCRDLVDYIGIAKRNSISILTGSGIVTSEYVLPDEFQAKYREHFRPAEWKKEPGTLKLWTLIQHGGNRSLIKFGPPGF